jgi:tryptophan synthase beta chain
MKFGRYGGLFVPETLVQPLLELAGAYEQMKNSDEFHRELKNLLKNFAEGRRPSTTPGI